MAVVMTALISLRCWTTLFLSSDALSLLFWFSASFIAWLSDFHSSLTVLTTSLKATRAFLILSTLGYLLRGDQIALMVSYCTAPSGSDGRTAGSGEGSSGSSTSSSESEESDREPDLVLSLGVLSGCFLGLPRFLGLAT